MTCWPMAVALTKSILCRITGIGAVFQHYLELFVKINCQKEEREEGILLIGVTSVATCRLLQNRIKPRQLAEPHQEV